MRSSEIDESVCQLIDRRNDERKLRESRSGCDYASERDDLAFRRKTAMWRLVQNKVVCIYIANVTKTAIASSEKIGDDMLSLTAPIVDEWADQNTINDGQFSWKGILHVRIFNSLLYDFHDKNTVRHYTEWPVRLPNQ